MGFHIRPCKLEMDYAAYISFLIQHQDELNLPYSFSTKLSFIGSPLVFGKAMIIINEEPYEVAGAAGFVYGTGSNQFEDRHVCQVEVAFLRKSYRRTAMFGRGLQALLKMIKDGEPAVNQLQFWVAADQADLKKLFSKFLALPGSTMELAYDMALYKIPYDALEAYCLRLKPTPVQGE